MMRKVLISLATAASALAFAAPASAQYFPQPQGYGYGYNNYGHVRAMRARLDHLQRRIVQFDRRGIISNREGRDLFERSRNIERRLWQASRNGLHPNEAYDIERRIHRLERRLHEEARDGRRDRRDRRDWREDHFRDRDRDGRPDRFEDDRGRDHDDD
jgi:hypothetical protein